jgi:hypothetical protein
MNISAREDIQTAISVVFARLTDFAAHEAAAAARRGVSVERLGRPNSHADRPAWKAVFQYGGREREVLIEVSDLHQPNILVAQVQHKGLEATVDIELVTLGKTRTRMIVGLELKPRSIKAKLVVQSLKIAKGSISGGSKTG